MGLEVELEHGTHDPETNVTGDDPVRTGKIALARLRELPDYYMRLAVMEAEDGTAPERRALRRAAPPHPLPGTGGERSMVARHPRASACFSAADRLAERCIHV